MFCINVVEMLENSVVEMLEKKPTSLRMLSKKGIVQLGSQAGRIYLGLCILMRTLISPEVQYNHKILETNSN